MNKSIVKITNRIIEKSKAEREAYKSRLDGEFNEFKDRIHLSCGNLAHGIAACDHSEKETISAGKSPNLGIITAYNDMLSAHKPYEHYPSLIRRFAKELNATAQVAGATPAMCDGVTQGQEGMDLSLMSRDLIALSSAIGLSHQMFDGVINLGICDKIVPGLLIGNLSFGHLPGIFLPGGPMPSGISNEQKAKIRQDFAEGKINRQELLKGELDSYHSPGTCTFYGTANSNQMLMEIMGLQLPGSSFVNPGTPMRDALNKKGVEVLVNNCIQKDINRTIGMIVSEKTIVNAIIGLLATGGSTNHTIHLIAIAKAAGIIIDWEDFSELSEVIPLIAKVYPNGAADINHFHAAGGMSFVIGSLLKTGLLHDDVQTVLGEGLSQFTKEPKLINGKIEYVEGCNSSLNDRILKPVDTPFQPNGGLKVLNGNIGKSVIKVSAVKEEHRIVEAPAIVFDDQNKLIEAYKRGELERDFIAVIPFQGPKQKGMPELHKLTPTLTILQKKGFKVGLVTDGRMSGASGKIPAAIHVSPEAAVGGNIGKIENGDLISLNAETGVLECAADLENREKKLIQYENHSTGRQMFDKLRTLITNSDEGASII